MTERVYLDDGEVVHLAPCPPEEHQGEPIRLCSDQYPRWPGPRWRGTGSEDERLEAKGRKLCRRCIVQNTDQPEVAAERPVHEEPLADWQILDSWLAENVTRERRARGLRQVELARRSGLSGTTLRRLEQGHGTHTSHVAMIAIALGVEVWHLYRPPWHAVIQGTDKACVI